MEEKDSIDLHIEALIFGSENPISEDEIQECLNKAFDLDINREDLKVYLDKIETHHSYNSIFELSKINGGYQFLTRKIYAPTLQILLSQKNLKKLSNAAMETLAIISYKQPVTKSEIEHIRGVNCDYSIQKLLEKELIQIDGKSETAGRPLIYSTSKYFMDYFKLDSLNQLPQIKDIGLDLN